MFLKMATMDEDQAKLIREYSEMHNEEGDYSYVLTDRLKQRFSISALRYANFLRDYCELVAGGTSFSIAEVGNDEITLNGNFRLCFFDQHGEGEVLTTGFHLALIKVYQDCISEFFVPTQKLSELVCFYLQSEPEIGEDEITHVNVRVQFPWCRMKLKVYDEEFKPKLIEKLSKSTINEHFIFPLTKSWNECLNDFYTIFGQNIVPMYGSIYPGIVETPKYRYFISQRITDEIIEEASELDLEGNENSFRKLDPRNHHVLKSQMTNTWSIGTENNEFWLPVFLSQYYQVSRLETKTYRIKKSESSADLNMDLEDVTSDNILPFLLKKLKKERFECPVFWSEVGEIIKNYYNKPTLYGSANGQGLKTWLYYSKLYGYSDEEAKRVWFNLPDDDRLTERRLAEYFKLDYPKQFEQWHKKWYENAFKDAIEDPTDDKLGKAFFRLFWLKFVFCSEAKGVWYEFDGTRLRRINDAKMKSFIREDYQRVLITMQEELSKEALSGRLTQEKEKQNILMTEKIVALRKKIQNMSSKKKILESAETYFDVADFSEYQNKNPRLLGTVNCVLEIVGEGRDRKIIPRTGFIEDYITFSTRTPYMDYTENHPDVQRVRTIIRQMMCYDKEMETRLWCKTASLLYGKNKDKLFSVATGDGDNGKSIYYKLIHCGMGDYYVDLPVEVLTSKQKSSSGPRPEMMMAKGTRIAVVSEHDKSKMVASLVKVLTGGDTLSIRGLFKDMVKFVQTYSLHLQTNDPPEFDDPSRSVKARVDIIPFIATFTHDAPETLEERIKTRKFPVNADLEEEVNKLGAAVLWCMVQDYALYVKCDLKKNVPNYIKNYMESYWSENDTYTKFIHNCLVRYNPNNADSDVSKNEKVHVDMVYKVFRYWYKEEKPDSRIPEKSFVVKSLKDPTRLGIYTKNHFWEGVSINIVILEKMNA